jgi:hypothetical protein
MTKLNLTTKALAFAKVMLVAVIFCGCGESAQDRANRYNSETPYVMEIDNCEYLVIEICSGASIINKGITHKGNCKFCAERSKK